MVSVWRESGACAVGVSARHSGGVREMCRLCVKRNCTERKEEEEETDILSVRG